MFSSEYFMIGTAYSTHIDWLNNICKKVLWTLVVSCISAPNKNFKIIPQIPQSHYFLPNFTELTKYRQISLLFLFLCAHEFCHLMQFIYYLFFCIWLIGKKVDFLCESRHCRQYFAKWENVVNFATLLTDKCWTN